MEKELRILIVEDVLADAELCERELKRAGLKFTALRVETRAAFERALREFTPDIILSDFSMPNAFDGLVALDFTREKSMDVPFVFVSGTIGEDRAVDAMKRGATDYVLKDRLQRLAPVVRRALQEAQERAELRKTERALRETEVRFHSFMQHLPGRASIRDLEGRYTFVNGAWERTFGRRAAEVVGRAYKEVWPLERAADVESIHHRVLETDRPASRVFRTGTDASYQWWHSTHFPIPDAHGKTSWIGTVAIDITEQKIQEDKIARLSRIHAVLSGINSAIVRIRDRQVLFEEACRIAVEHGNFGLAWIGLFDPTTLDVTPVAWAGIGWDEFNRTKSSARADVPLGQGVVGRAIRERKPVFDNDISANPGVAGKRRQEALQLGYRSLIALPLFAEEAVAGILALFVKEPNFFDEEEVKLLTELAGDISFALEHIAKQQKIEKLSRIRAVSSRINAAIVRIRERQALFEETCRIAAEHGKFDLVWIGTINPEKQEVRPVAWTGFSEETAHAVSWATISAAKGTLGEAIRTRKPAVRNDVEAELPSGKLRQEALKKGCRSTVCLPLVVDDNVVALIVLFAAGRGFFDEGELALLNELAADVSFALQSIAQQEKVEYLSYYDTLTELPNRHLFIDRLSQQLRARSGEPRMVALILLNLGRFRNINETLGRHGGDELLKLIARRLELAFHGKDYLARIGNDDYGIIMRGVQDAARVAHAIENELFACFKQTFVVSGKELRVSAKAGVAMFPADGQDADTLFRNAEAAVKRAKASGDPYLFYAAEMNSQAAQTLSLETRLRKAVDARQFVLHYQPKIELATGRVCGLEALIRWNDPETGLVPPGSFIPLLEETGLILEVGRWALAQALLDYRDWTARGCTVPRIAVNVSAIQLQQKDFADMVVDAVQQAGDLPHALELELTESLLMKDVEASIRKLSTLREQGIHVAMDDFGTGYSSLSYIARLPIDMVKIDRSFISGMAGEGDNTAIVTTIIALAHSLNLRVVAEGVETEQQAQLLRILRCDEAQGYLFSRPLPAAEVAAKFLGAAGAA